MKAEGEMSAQDYSKVKSAMDGSAPAPKRRKNTVPPVPYDSLSPSSKLCITFQNS